jgi:sterol desaturase/sphingolipid hydroxylase (fatty acid hydroxylase superfamily)
MQSLFQSTLEVIRGAVTVPTCLAMTGAGLLLWAKYLPQASKTADTLTKTKANVRQHLDATKLSTPLRGLYSAWGLLITFTIPLVSYELGLGMGLLWYFSVSMLTQAVDLIMSDHFAANLATLRLNNFSLPRVMTTMLFNNSSAGATIGGAIFMFCPAEGMQQHFDLALVGKVVTMMVVADFAFFLGHRWLHQGQTLSDLHVMHHCCWHASYTTNLIFHPVDLMIEFSMPTITTIVLGAFVFKDPFALMMTLCVFQAWYAADHDAFLRLPHMKAHHGFCDSVSFHGRFHSLWKNSSACVRACACVCVCVRACGCTSLGLVSALSHILTNSLVRDSFHRVPCTDLHYLFRFRHSQRQT